MERQDSEERQFFQILDQHHDRLDPRSVGGMERHLRTDPQLSWR